MVSTANSRLLTTEQIKTTKEEIVSMTESLEEQEAVLSEKKTELSSIKTEISNTEDALENLTKLHRETEIEVRTADRKIFYFNDQIQKSRELLQSNARLQKIEDLYNEQPSFFESLEKRLEKKQEELAEETGGFVKFAKPSQTVASIKNYIGRANDFRDQTISMRSAKHNYEQAVRALCEKKIDGTKITPADAMSHLLSLDVFLMSQAVAGLWQLG